MEDILVGILGSSCVIGIGMSIAINEAEVNLWVKKKKESDWWTNKTVVGKTIIVICGILGIVGIITLLLGCLVFEFWEKYCVKQGE